MTEQDLINIFTNSGKEELSTSELYEIAIREFQVDRKYADYEHHIRAMQQHLKTKGILQNTRRGYWAFV